jgi:hypothetical protein
MVPVCLADGGDVAVAPTVLPALPSAGSTVVLVE